MLRNDLPDLTTAQLVSSHLVLPFLPLLSLPCLAPPLLSWACVFGEPIEHAATSSIVAGRMRLNGSHRNSQQSASLPSWACRKLSGDETMET